MEFESGRLGGGSAMERGRTTSMPGQLGLGVERVDGSGSRRREQGSGSAPTSDARAAFGAAAGRQAEQGDGSAPYINRVSMDETRRRGNCNLDNEDDVVMRNDSAPRETAWKAAVLDPYTHYQINMSKITDYALALTDAIEKIADPETAVLAIDEVSTYRECRGRFGQRLARSSAEKMSPTEWWFQFGGEVPNLQKCALRIVSQCVSSSGCERNWSAFALVHTKQRNRLLYDKLHKLVSVRYNLKIRVEEEQDPMRENDKQKEVDPCAMMMDTTMFDATNPMMEWLNEDEEHVVLDGVDAASAVFEQLRFLNSSRKASHLGRKDNGKKRKRVEEEEEDYNDSEDDEEENEELEFNDEDDDDIQEDGASQSDGGDSPMQVEKDLPSRVGNNNEVASDGSLVNRRSERVRQAKKVKEVTSLYN